MRYTYGRDRTALPLWALLGAPAVGVPLMVVLLALAGPKSEGLVEEPIAEVVTVPVDVRASGALVPVTDETLVESLPEASSG